MPDNFNDSLENGSRAESHVLRLILELRQRKVCRAAVAYMLVVWMVVQIADVTFPLLGISDWTMRFIVGMAALGFPVAVVLAWIFEITPEGIVVDKSHQTHSPRIRKLDLMVNFLLLALGSLFAGLFFFRARCRRTDEGTTGSLRNRYSSIG